MSPVCRIAWIKISWLVPFLLILAAISHDVRASTYSGDLCMAPGEVSHAPLDEDFSGPGIDPCKWEIVRSNWGGQRNGEDYNGGAVPENVSLRDRTLILTARGNFYDGPVRGVDSQGNPRETGKRSGAAIMTRQRYLGGRFDARVKIAGHFGVVSAMWTFFLDTLPGGTIRNHEIDIEFPGNADADSGPSFDHVTFTTWIGLKAGESTAMFRALHSTMADGKFHQLSFEWIPPAAGEPGMVAFYLDGQQLAISRTNVPSEPANLWLGAWFPPDWAGIPDFDQAEMLVESVRITPLSQTAAN
jgi:beta-glucanase (GH16 family)